MDSAWFRKSHEANGNWTLNKYLVTAYTSALLASSYDRPTSQLPPKIAAVIWTYCPKWEDFKAEEGYTADLARTVLELRKCLHNLALAYGALYDNRRCAELTPIIKAFHEFAFRRLANIAPDPGTVRRATQLPKLIDYAVNPDNIPTAPKLSRHNQRVAWHADREYRMVPFYRGTNTPIPEEER
jgi:hypothetical protein